MLLVGEVVFYSLDRNFRVKRDGGWWIVDRQVGKRKEKWETVLCGRDEEKAMARAMA